MKYCWFPLLLLMTFSYSPLSAQSFLSLKKRVTEIEPTQSATTGSAEKTGIHTTGKPVLSTPLVPDISHKKEPVENISIETKSAKLSDTVDQVAEINISRNAGETILNSNLLKRASDLVYAGEYGHAKALLKNIDLTMMEDLSEEERFNQGEQHLFLLLKTSFLLGDFQQVVNLAPGYFNAYGNGKYYYVSYYYFAASLGHLKEPLKMVYLVTDEFFSGLSNRESRNLRELLIEDALKKEQPLNAYHFMLDSENHLIDEFNHTVSDLIEKIEDIEDIDIILSDDPVDQVKSLAELRKVQLLIRDGEYQAAQDFLSLLFNSDDVDVTTLAELQGFQNYIDTALNTKPYRIGVILPLSHRRFGMLARQALDGLELALQSRFPSDQPIHLIVKDSARNPSDNGKEIRLTASERSTLVQNQVRELVEEDRVIAILGPLAKNTSLAAGETAEFYKVPVISFSITEELGKEMPFLFRFQRNRIVEAENLARYALDYLNAERFVLFYTVDKSGKGFKIMQAFNRIIMENGGEIAGISPINYNQVDFKDNYLSITGGFRKQLEEEEEKEKEEEDPTIDFDLMFVPVPLNTLKIVLDFNRSYDAEKVWVLSGAETNVRENQLLDHTRQLRFIDAFPIGSTGTYLQPFYEEHWRSYNFRPDYRPPTSYTIYAYEALEIVAKLLNDPRYHNRESLRNAIQHLEGFPILTGTVSCGQNRELIKQLNILKIKSKNTVAVF